MVEIKRELVAAIGGHSLLIYALLYLSLAPTRMSAQTEQRSLRTWVDTLDQQLCGEGEFDRWGVWVASIGNSDTVTGFRLKDSVLSVELTLRWDPARIQLLPPYVLDPVSTLLGRFVSKVQGVDTATGELYVSASTDQSFRPSVGEGIPLFYLNGRVRPTDSVFLPPEGGAKIQRLTIEGRLAESLSSVRHEAGFVQVTRDTTPEYTGSIEIDDLELDTLRVGTMALYARNFGERRVTDLSFVLRSDSDKIVIRDIILPGSGEAWEGLVSVERQDSSAIKVNVGSGGEDPIPAIDDSKPVLSLLLTRREDSLFSTSVIVTDVLMNETSCLGKVDSGVGQVQGATIDTTRDSVSTVTVQANHAHEGNLRHWIVPGSNGDWVIVDPDVREVEIYDVSGRLIGKYRSEGANRLRFERETPHSGLVFALIRLRDGSRIHVKQYIESI